MTYYLYDILVEIEYKISQYMFVSIASMNKCLFIIITIKLKYSITDFF